MLNSCGNVRSDSGAYAIFFTNLLNRHHNLHGVETVQTEIIVEVCLGVQLNCVSIHAINLPISSCTFEVSVTCFNLAEASACHH